VTIVQATEKLATSPVAGALLRQLTPLGLVGLGLIPNEPRQFLSTRPLIAPPDFGGARLRINDSPETPALATAIGGDPVQGVASTQVGAYVTTETPADFAASGVTGPDVQEPLTYTTHFYPNGTFYQTQQPDYPDQPFIRGRYTVKGDEVTFNSPTLDDNPETVRWSCYEGGADLQHRERPGHRGKGPPHRAPMAQSRLTRPPAAGGLAAGGVRADRAEAACQG
jgi:hypothetical protein